MKPSLSPEYRRLSSPMPFSILEEAIDLNDAGDIVGYGTDGDLNFTAGFLAIPN